MKIWLAVFLGGGLGSMARFGISRLVLMLEVRGNFPWATLASNLLATAILAWLVLRMQGHLQTHGTLWAFLAIGFCGGFSTFSTFSQENFLLLRSGMLGYAAVNVLLSAAAGIALFYLITRSS